MRKHALATMMILGLGCLSLGAQAASDRSPFEASLSGVIGTADTKKIAKSNPAGYLIGLGFRAEMHPGLSSRIHLGFMSFAGKEGTGLENRNRPQFHFGWDVMKEYGSLSLFGGLTGTQWKQSISATDPNFTLANRAEGIKIGARVGAEYSVGKGFGLQLTFDQTGFNRKFNPSWVGAGVVYRFKE